MVSSDKASRQVVVLRQGPPAHRTALVDGVAGVVGVALIVLAGVLGEVLPEEDPVQVQYQTQYPLHNFQAAVSYTDAGGTEHISRNLIFNGLGDNPPMPLEGETHDIAILVEHDNVISFKVRIVMRDGDDLPSSLPDVFQFELFDPEGASITDPWRVLTISAQRQQLSLLENQTLDLYVSPPVSHPELKRFRGQPEDEFIGSQDPDFSAEEALLVASERYTLPSRGTQWTLRMTMVTAGDCEPVAPDPAVIERRSHCLSQAGQDGNDPGNPVIISEVLYDYYTIEITE